MKLSRRTLFKSAAAAALLGPALRSFEARAAGTPIKRFITLLHPNGNDFGSLGPQWVNGAIDFGSFYGPLARHRAEAIVLKGVRLGGIPWGSEQPDEVGHGSGGWACLTARSSQGTSSATGPSVDQFIARKLFEQGLAPNANAPVFRVGPMAGAGWQSHYEAAGRPVPHLTTPTQAFQMLFSGLMGGGSGGDQALARAIARKRSVLDAAWQDCKGSLSVLPAEGRVQVDEYCARIRDLELALQAPAPMGPTCSAPAVGALANLDVDDPNNYAAVCDYFFRCIEAAFACDVTRVASFTFGTSAVRFNMPWLNLPTYDFGSGISGSDHHTYSHGELPTQLARFVDWYASRFAALLDRLKTPQADGSRLLDDTLVYWTGEIGNTWPSGAGGALHDLAEHTMFVFGGANSPFRHGRLHQLPVTRWVGYQSAEAKRDAVHHHALLVSLIQAMGISGVSQFGDPNGGSGPLALLTA